VRLDQSRRDLQVGPDIPGVDPAGDPSGRRADERVLLQPGAVVVLDRIASHDLRAEHLLLLGGRTGPVQAGGDQDQGALAGDPGLFQDLEHRPQDRLIGDRSGDVADQDAGVLPTPGDLSQGGGADRLLERRGDVALGVVQRRHVTDRQRTDDPIRGKLDGQSGPAIIQRQFHGLPRAA
jgi:hypothetical protein